MTPEMKAKTELLKKTYEAIEFFLHPKSTEIYKRQ